LCCSASPHEHCRPHARPARGRAPALRAVDADGSAERMRHERGSAHACTTTHATRGRTSRRHRRAPPVFVRCTCSSGASLSSPRSHRASACSVESEAPSATQAHLEALDGAGVVSVGPAGVITSSWRCSARAERRAAADRTGLLHSLAAAAPRAPRLQSGRRDVSLRTGCVYAPSV